MTCILYWLYVFFFKQKTAYEMRISDWSSDVCSSDLSSPARTGRPGRTPPAPLGSPTGSARWHGGRIGCRCRPPPAPRPAQALRQRRRRDRKSVVSGKSVSVRVDLGGRRVIKHKNSNNQYIHTHTLLKQQHKSH